MREIEPGGVECLQKRRLGLVPHCVVADTHLRTIGELDTYLVETEVFVDAKDQIAHSNRLLRDLLRGAEDVRIILGECAHAHHAVQCSRRLVAMAFPEFGQPAGQVAIARDALLEDLDVAGAVHRLYGVKSPIDCF